MNIETEITEIKEKLDRLLFIMGEGRDKSDAELDREVAAGIARIKARDERRKERKHGKV
jgi:hypothetical protein